MIEIKYKTPIKTKRIRIYDDYAELELTKGKWAKIDIDDIPLVVGASFSYTPWHTGHTGYAVTVTHHLPYRRLHQNILGKKDGYVIDHINGDGLDNRRSNLRFATHGENIRNGKSRSNKTGAKGVSQTSSGRFRAVIFLNGRNQHLGTFDSVEEASKAYKKAADEHYGEFANYNEPQEESTTKYVYARNGTGYKGVQKSRWNTWIAQIVSQGKKVHLGSFKTPEEAAEAYNEAANRLHGEYAYQNEVPPNKRGAMF